MFFDIMKQYIVSVVSVQNVLLKKMWKFDGEGFYTGLKTFTFYWFKMGRFYVDVCHDFDIFV